MKPELTTAITVIKGMTPLQHAHLIGWMISAAKDTPAIERELIDAVKFATKPKP